MSTSHQKWTPAQLAHSQPMSSCVLSPDASTVAFVQKREGVTVLVLKDVDGAGPESPIALSPEPEALLAWSEDGESILYQAKTGSIARWPLGGLECEILGEFADVVWASANEFGSAVAVVEDFERLFVLRADGSRIRVDAKGEFVNRATVSPDGIEVAWVEWEQPHMEWQQSRIMRASVDPVIGAATHPEVVVEDIGAQFQLPKYSRDGRYLSFLTDRSGWLNLAVVDTTAYAHEIVPLPERAEQGTTSHAKGNQYAWSADSKYVYLCRIVKAGGELVRIDIADGSAQPLAEGVFTEVVETKGVLIALGASAKTPQTLLNLTSREALAHSAPVQVAQSMPAPENVEFDSEGSTIPARLYRTDPEPKPLVVSLHGGPNDQSSATYNWRWAHFLQKGWAVLVVDYRGSTGWGRELTDALNGGWGEADVADTLEAMEVAVDRGWADPERIMLIGGSAAGLTALNALSDQRNKAACACVDYPVTDLAALADSTWRYEAHYFESIVGPSEGNAELYRQRSPISRVSEIEVPVLVVQGDDDKVVPKEETDRFVTAMIRQEKAIDYHVIEGEGHGFRKMSSKVKEMELIDEFISEVFESSQEEQQ